MDETARAIVVRDAADAADLELVRELMGEYREYLANHPAGPEHFRWAGVDEEMSHLPGEYVAPGGLLLAFVDGATAGCVGLKRIYPHANRKSLIQNSDSGMALELKRLWVRPGFRGLRLGQRLIEESIGRARAAGAGTMYLDTVPAAMPEASRLYAALGFRLVPRYNDNQVKGVEFFALTLAPG